MKYSKEELRALRMADRMTSGRVQKKMADKHLVKGREKELWQSFERQQQQMPFGFSYVGGGISIPATVTWLSQAWDNTATYPAGVAGYPVAGSFIQLNSVVYAIPGAVASTPGTPPPGGVFVIQPPSPGGNGWNVNPQPRLSTFAQPTSFFPTPPIYTDVVDSYWYPGDLQVMSTTASQRYFPAPGRGYLVSASATTFSTVQINIAGTPTTIFTFTGTTFQWVELDGLTISFLSSGTTRNTVTTYRIRQSAQ